MLFDTVFFMPWASLAFVRNWKRSSPLSTFVKGCRFEASVGIRDDAKLNVTMTERQPIYFPFRRSHSLMVLFINSPSQFSYSLSVLFYQYSFSILSRQG
jgi:hypothetical protein